MVAVADDQRGIPAAFAHDLVGVGGVFLGAPSLLLNNDRVGGHTVVAQYFGTTIGFAARCPAGIAAGADNHGGVALLPECSSALRAGAQAGSRRQVAVQAGAEHDDHVFGFGAVGQAVAVNHSGDDQTDDEPDAQQNQQNAQQAAVDARQTESS